MNSFKLVVSRLHVAPGEGRVRALQRGDHSGGYIGFEFERGHHVGQIQGRPHRDREAGGNGLEISRFIDGRGAVVVSRAQIERVGGALR